MFLASPSGCALAEQRRPLVAGDAGDRHLGAEYFGMALPTSSLERLTIGSTVGGMR